MSDLDQQNDRAAFEACEDQRRHPLPYPSTRRERLLLEYTPPERDPDPTDSEQ